MAASFQSPLTSNTSVAAGHTSHTLSVTVSAGAQLVLAVCFHAELTSAVASGVTFGGVALTKLDSQNASGSFGRSEIWYLINPTPSTANVVVTHAATDHSVLGVIVGTGVDQVTPLRTAAKANTTGTSSSVTVLGVTTDDLVFDCLTLDGTGHLTVTGANQTEQYDLEPAAGSMTGVCDTQLGSDGGVMSHTWTTSADNAHVGTAFIGAAAAGGPSAIPDFLRSSFPFMPMAWSMAVDSQRGLGTFPTAMENSGPAPFGGFERFMFPRLHPVFGGATFNQALDANAIVTAAINRSVGKTVTATATTTATIVRSVGKFVTATSTSTATIVRSVGKTVTANATSTASIVKSVGKTMGANATVTAVLTALKAALLTMTATVTSTATITRSVGKGVSATVTSTATMVRQTSKTLAATATATATMVRQIGKKITANATVTATLSAIKAVLLTMTATVTSTASIVKRVGKNMVATATSTATIRRSVGHAMVATVTSTATITRQVAKTLTATVTSVATMVAQFISGSAQTIYTRFFGSPSPDDAELGGSPGGNTFGGSPDSDDFGPGSPGSGGFGPPGPGRS